MQDHERWLNSKFSGEKVERFVGFTVEELCELRVVLECQDKTLEEFLEPFQPSKTPALDEAVVMAEQFALDSNMRNPGPIIERVARAAREDIKRNAK